MIVRFLVLVILGLGLLGDNPAVDGTRLEELVQASAIGLMIVLTVYWFAHTDGRMIIRILVFQIPLLLMIANQLFVQQFMSGANNQMLVVVFGYAISAFACMAVIPSLLMQQGLLRWFTNIMFWLTVGLSLAAILGSVIPVGAVGPYLSQKANYSFAGLHASGGLLGHPITMSMQAAVAVVAGGYLMREARRRWPYACGIALVLLGAFVTLSRSGWAGLAAAIPVFAIVTIWKVRTMSYFAGLALVVLVAAGAYNIAANSPTLSSLLRLDRGLSGREELWEISRGLVEQEPFGRGNGEAMRELQNYMFFEAGGSMEEAPGAGNHSNFVDAAVNFGIQGAALLYVVILYCIFWGLRSSWAGAIGSLTVAIGTGYLVGCHFISINIGGVRFTAICYAVFLGLGPIVAALGKVLHKSNRLAPMSVVGAKLLRSAS